MLVITAFAQSLNYLCAFFWCRVSKEIEEIRVTWVCMEFVDRTVRREIRVQKVMSAGWEHLGLLDHR